MRGLYCAAILSSVYERQAITFLTKHCDMFGLLRIVLHTSLGNMLNTDISKRSNAPLLRSIMYKDRYLDAHGQVESDTL